MPAKFDVTMTRDAMYKCLPEDIEVRPDLNGRHDKPDIEWLIADILKVGQLQPVIIWNDGGAAVLSAGFSRWRAVSEINRRKLYAKEPWKIKCVFANTNHQGAFLRNISENRMRNPTTPIDDAHNIQRLLEVEQMDEKQIAQIYFPIAATEDELKEAVKWVRGRVELIKLSPEAERAVIDGRLNETAAAAIAKLSSAQQREALKREGKLSAKDIKTLTPKKARPVKPTPIEPELKRRITAVIESAEWEDFNEELFHGMILVNAEVLAALKHYVIPE